MLMQHSFVRTRIEREEVESTSDLARDLIESNAIELPLLVRARRQTRGRGRGENAWWSDSGSLTFTVGFDPQSLGLKPEQEPRVGLASALAVIEGLASFIRIGIRWPNDLEVGGRKLGGILPERIETNAGVRMLVGIGINLETEFKYAPLPIRRLAVSLRELVGAVAIDSDQVLARVLERLRVELGKLAGDDDSLAIRWQKHDDLLGKPVRVDVGSRIVEGVARGIESDGSLRLELPAETIKLYGGRVIRQP
jgi:BirA family biotin operon repressor/biotin-[acetyl-CoA-carboxylase] ligase